MRSKIGAGRVAILVVLLLTARAVIVASATVTSPTSGQTFCVGDTVTINSNTGKASARLPDGQCVNYGTLLSPLPISGTASSIGDRMMYDAYNCVGNSITYRVAECPILTVDKSTVAAGETITVSGMASGAVSLTFFPESTGYVVTSTLYADPYTKKFSTSASTSGLSAGTYSIKATSGGKTLSLPVTVYQVVVGSLARISAELSASNTAPELNENVTLTASIKNVGQQQATNVAVKFSIDGTEKTECAKTVDIAGGGNATATCVAAFVTAATVTAKVEATCSMCETGYKTAYKTVSINAGAPVVVGTLARVSATELSASNTAPEVNENVIMTATIRNDGQQKATGVAVKFSVDAEEMTGCTATGDIDGGKSATATCFMNFHAAGTYTVMVDAICNMCETGYKSAYKTIAITASATTPATTTPPIVTTPVETTAVAATTAATTPPIATTVETTTPPLTYVCTPNDKRCFGDYLQQCTSDGGMWKSIEECPYGCDNATKVCSATTQVKTTLTPPTPAFEIVFAVTGLLAIAYLLKREEKL